MRPSPRSARTSRLVILALLLARADQGIELGRQSHAPAPLRRDFGEVSPAQIYEWACRHVPASADAVVIAGNGLRAIGAIEALEKHLDRPVLTANQVAFWHALRLAGVNAPIGHYGRIFDADLPAGP